MKVAAVSLVPPTLRPRKWTVTVFSYSSYIDIAVNTGARANDSDEGVPDMSLLV